jgi:hypothetical protein
MERGSDGLSICGVLEQACSRAVTFSETTKLGIDLGMDGMHDLDTAAPIKLLHLSDLHFGLTEQDWMWPTFRTQLFQDLRNLHGRTGPWDLVIFSGDLTQQGSAAEFDKLTDVLSNLWEHFRSLGSNPQLLVIPGNHDLARPSDLDPTGRVMSQWWIDVAVQTDFWKSSSSLYRTAVASWFENFVAWSDQLGSTIPVVETTKGMLPGDFSATIEKGAQPGCSRPELSVAATLKR